MQENGNQNDVKNIEHEPLNAKKGEKPKMANGSKLAKQTEEVITLQLNDIVLDGDYCVRPKLHEKAVKKYSVYYVDYKEAIDRGEDPEYPLDLITVWYDKSRDWYVLLCGYLRVAAARIAGLVEIQALVFRGTPDEAFQIALTDNSKHGESMSNGDTKHAILKALERYQGIKGLREIARELGCSPSYISRINKELYRKKSSATPKDTDKQSQADTPRKSDSKPTLDQTKSLDVIIEESKAYFDDRLQRLSDAEERHAYHTRIIGWLVKNHEKSRSTVSGL